MIEACNVILGSKKRIKQMSVKKFIMRTKNKITDLELCKMRVDVCKHLYIFTALEVGISIFDLGFHRNFHLRSEISSEVPSLI